MPNYFVILGIHDEDVVSVDGNYARVRMFVGDKVIDEDFDLPNLYPSVKALDKSIQANVYKDILTDTINARIIEINNNVAPEQSKLIPIQKERIVFDNPVAQLQVDAPVDVQEAVTP